MKPVTNLSDAVVRAEPGTLVHLELDVHTSSPVTLPSEQAFRDTSVAFSFFNDRLFENALPAPLVTLVRKRNALGYFCENAFADRDGNIAHEIALNPSWIRRRGDADTYSTLVHEMCHLWRCVCGGLNRRRRRRDAPGYHSAVWGRRMEAIGLIPSDTGRPGGKQTGYRVSHYVVEGGPFDVACREWLIIGNRLRWADAKQNLEPDSEPIQPPAAAPTRARFVCGSCSQRAWAKPSAKLACAKCQNAPMRAA